MMMPPTDVASSIQGIDEFAMEAIEAYYMLEERSMSRQSEVILFSAIDTMAWISKASGDVNRHDFMRWVTDYMLVDSPLTCTALELYSARCGLLHSTSASSGFTRRNEARQIWYAGSDELFEGMKAFAAQYKKLPPEGVVVVRTGDLAMSFVRGTHRFLEFLQETPASAETAAERFSSVLWRLPSQQEVQAAQQT